MKQRTMDEMITYFNQQVDKMDIDCKYKMALLGMITAIGYENKKQERKTGRWILHENQRQEDVDNGNYLYICSECGKSDIHAKTQEVPFCWWCGARMMEVEHDEC